MLARWIYVWKQWLARPWMGLAVSYCPYFPQYMWENCVEKVDRGQRSEKIRIKCKLETESDPDLASRSPLPDNSFWSQALADIPLPQLERDIEWIRVRLTQALRSIIGRTSSEHHSLIRVRGIRRGKRCCSCPHSLLNKTFRRERPIWPRLRGYRATLSTQHRQDLQLKDGEAFKRG